MSSLFGGRRGPQSPAIAYDKWSETYDHESGNLMVALDDHIFPELLQGIPIAGKLVADIGCGTGRHWAMLLSMHPASLRGYDVSVGMLKQLRQKHPGAEVYVITDHRLPDVEDGSLDIIVSTLSLVYFTSLEQTFNEWNRVLKPGGNVVFTSTHPEALQHGANVTFAHSSGIVTIEQHIHTLADISQLADYYGWSRIAFVERKIDETVRHFYEQQHALHVYEKFKTRPIIYGVHYRKKGVSNDETRPAESDS